MKDKKPLEQRSYCFEVRAEENDEGGKIITGRPIVYDSRADLGFFDEIIAGGALDRSDLTDVRFLVNHDKSRIPLARSRRSNGNSTMLLTVDNQGMGIRVDLDTENNSEARALYSAVERGDISGMSFMFTVRDEEWRDIDTDHPTRIIKDIGTVVEVSAVTFPAYASTEIFARSGEALENALHALENAREEQRAKSPEGDHNHELELAKAKFEFISKS